MALPGPAPRPPLAVVREGNPGHRPIREGLKLPPADHVEPDWEQTFPRVKIGREPVPLTADELADYATPEGRDRAIERREHQLDAHRRRVTSSREATRCRAVARREWRRVVPVLEKTAGLTAVDAAVLHDLCVVVARIDQCERDISRNGISSPGHRGAVRNPAGSAVVAYRAQLKTYIGELGLSPSARGRLTPASGGDDGDDDVFD